MRLVGDIGGTNARFAIAEPGELPHDIRKLPAAQYASLIEAAQDYLSGGPTVDEAVLAVAGPVLGDEVRFSNSTWRFSIDDVRRRLGLRKPVVINDLVAQALSLAGLRPDEIGSVKSGARNPAQPVLVIGPGTGLGVAFLLNRAGKVVGLPSEAGHATFAPMDRVQAEILSRLKRQYSHVSVERLLSGAGLLAIATTLAEINGQKIDVHDPRDVSSSAAAGQCPTCCEAIRIFSSILGSTAGSLALTLLNWRRGGHHRWTMSWAAPAVGCGGAHRVLRRKGTVQVISGWDTHRPDIASSCGPPGRSNTWEGEPLPLGWRALEPHDLPGRQGKMAATLLHSTKSFAKERRDRGKRANRKVFRVATCMVIVMSLCISPLAIAP